MNNGLFKPRANYSKICVSVKYCVLDKE